MKRFCQGNYTSINKEAPEIKCLAKKGRIDATTIAVPYCNHVVATHQPCCGDVSQSACIQLRKNNTPFSSCEQRRIGMNDSKNSPSIGRLLRRLSQSGTVDGSRLPYRVLSSERVLFLPNPLLRFGFSLPTTRSTRCVRTSSTGPTKRQKTLSVWKAQTPNNETEREPAKSRVDLT